MDNKELEKLKKLPYTEQKEITDKKCGFDIRKNFIRKTEDGGGKVMTVSGIKEAIQAKQYLERNGSHEVKIVGGTNKPFVIFK